MSLDPLERNPFSCLQSYIATIRSCCRRRCTSLERQVHNCSFPIFHYDDDHRDPFPTPTTYPLAPPSPQAMDDYYPKNLRLRAVRTPKQLKTLQTVEEFRPLSLVRESSQESLTAASFSEGLLTPQALSTERATSPVLSFGFIDDSSTSHPSPKTIEEKSESMWTLV